MNINKKIMGALSELVDGHIWALSKPAEEDPDIYIVFNPELDAAEDFGDDEDLAWNQYMQVHWFGRGRVNYLQPRKQIRKALKEAGLIVDEITVIHEGEAGGKTGANSKGWTHMVFSCNAEEDLDES